MAYAAILSVSDESIKSALPTSPALPPGSQIIYPIGNGEIPAFLMYNEPATCSSIRYLGDLLFINIMNVIASAAGDNAAAP